MRKALSLLALVAVAGPAAADATDGMKKGTPEIKSVTALAFGPDGVLFVGDPTSATIFAIATGDTKPAGAADLKIEQLGEKVGSMLGVPADQITVNDVKTNPASGVVYLAVTRGKGADAAPVLFNTRDGKLAEVALKDVPFAAVKLPNANDRQRAEAITGMGFVGGKLFVSGLSNEEFASTLRAIKFPFADADKGTSVEIFHGAHGKYETQAPVRTFVAYKVAEREEILAAYTCTPLVRIPTEEIKPGAKVKGTTIAELGNRNRPLDMIVYGKDGKDYILMANNARGVMKIPTETFASAASITEPVRGGGTAGVKYETVAALKDVQQLDKLDDARAVVLVKTGTGGLTLMSVPLP